MTVDARPTETTATADGTAAALSRCPVCRARLSGVTLCPRCGAELGSVAAAVRAARAAEGRAVHHLAQGRTEAAATALAEARAQSRSAFGDALAEFVASLAGERR